MSVENPNQIPQEQPKKLKWWQRGLQSLKEGAEGVGKVVGFVIPTGAKKFFSNFFAQRDDKKIITYSDLEKIKFELPQNNQTSDIETNKAAQEINRAAAIRNQAALNAQKHNNSSPNPLSEEERKQRAREEVERQRQEVEKENDAFEKAKKQAAAKEQANAKNAPDGTVKTMGKSSGKQMASESAQEEGIRPQSPEKEAAAGKRKNMPKDMFTPTVRDMQDFVHSENPALSRSSSTSSVYTSAGNRTEKASSSGKNKERK